MSGKPVGEKHYPTKVGHGGCSEQLFLRGFVAFWSFLFGNFHLNRFKLSFHLIWTKTRVFGGTDLMKGALSNHPVSNHKHFEVHVSGMD